MTLPVETLAAFTVVAILAGIGAAIMPARRASRLNVLDALHYEQPPSHRPASSAASCC